MSQRNSYTDYSQYLKSQNTEECSRIARDYDKQYNRAFRLKDSNPTEAVNILTVLYGIKRNPDVLSLLQDLSGSNPEC